MSDRDIIGTISSEPSIKGEFAPDLVIKGSMEARFPANVYVISPVVLDRAGGNYTFSIDLNEIIANLPPSGVASVFGRTGDVTAQTGDYTFAQIGSTPTTISGYGITDAQPLDSDLTAIAALSSTGFAARTTTDTWAQRTITGTANAISVTNGDGVSGNPTLAISTDAALPGNPTTTTQAVDNSTTRIATTAYVVGQAASATPLGNLATGVVGTSTRFARADHVHPGREVLTASRTYYVRTDGSNSNNGLANTSGGAFLTIQKALDTVAALDISIYNVTIQVADGTYSAGNLVNGPWLGSGVVTVIGNTTTPANVVVDGGGSNAFAVSNGGSLSVSGAELRGNVGLLASNNGSINTGISIRFGAVTAYQAYATNNGAITLGANYSIVGGGLAHVIVDSGGNIKGTSLTVTLTGTPAFTVFAQASRTGYIAYYLNTFTGSATGSRYTAASGGFIDVNSAGTSYLPGNSAGSGTNFGASPYGLYA